MAHRKSSNAGGPPPDHAPPTEAPPTEAPPTEAPTTEEHAVLTAVSPTVHTVDISDLLPADSPRSVQEDDDHVRTLAESDAPLPPVIVHAGTLRLIDGTHRVHAARLRGQTTVPARFYEGPDDGAFVLAVASNVRHGLPLSRAERLTAAERVLESHPHWSDRAVAHVTGLSATTIGKLRQKCATGREQQLHTRIGRDGRARPVDGADGRERAAAFLRRHPDASLRQVAQAAGISPGTARDVRRRLQSSEDPLPPRLRRRTGRGAAQADPPGPPDRTGRRPSGPTLAALMRDPSLRHTQTGRLLLKLLDNRLLSQAESERLIAGLPPHSLSGLSAAARECAQVWLDFSRRLEERG
ncbi:transcriptional regulator [Streptomyces sp. Ru62]|uniref:ParB/RepB/Spo0J family partition protein n=1 Tax=Streptomyces sp. Ru62 TaxID=2080745 RepID=UPI000CDDEC77|nr:ParB N-terminal domain-containing protein [Streptomyces sp. Ru62]POX63425.1 transcriptional regulator [Streptomyces sp. Ru62]